MLTILLFLLAAIIGLALLVGAIIVVLALIIGVVKYALHPKALFADLKADIKKRI